MKRALCSLVFGVVVAGVISPFALALDRPGQDRLFPDCLLRPGLYISIFMPDSHFDEGTLVEGSTSKRGNAIKTSPIEFLRAIKPALGCRQCNHKN